MTGTRLRFLASAWAMHLRQIITIRSYLFDAVVVPVILCTLLVRMLSGHGGVPASAAVVGSAVMGMWAVTLTGTGAAVGRMRAMGVLEPVVAAPTPLAYALSANALASSTLGVLSLGCTVVWARLVLGVRLEVEDPLLLTVGTLVTVVATAALGLLLSVALVLYPRAQSVSSIFEYPLWILAGAIVPLERMPEWVDRLSWWVAPRWGVQLMHESLDGAGQDVAGVLAAAVGTLVAYWALSALLLRGLETRARAEATLPLS